MPIASVLNRPGNASLFWPSRSGILQWPDLHNLASRYEKSLSRCLERLFRLVEIVGVEPTTPCLQSRCSSQLSYTPESGCKDATNYWNLQIFVALFYYFIPYTPLSPNSSSILRSLLYFATLSDLLRDPVFI